MEVAVKTGEMILTQRMVDMGLKSGIVFCVNIIQLDLVLVGVDIMTTEAYEGVDNYLMGTQNFPFPYQYRQNWTQM